MAMPHLDLEANAVCEINRFIVVKGGRTIYLYIGGEVAQVGSYW